MPKLVAADPPVLEVPQFPRSESPAIGVHADRRIPSLDGLRAVASLMVLCYHFGPHIIRTQSRFDILNRLPQFTWAGVDLFFVLSGFLISGILLDSRQSPRYFKVFYARRVFRIFPLYYLVLFGYLCALAIFGARTAELGRLFENPISPWAYLLYIQNFAMTAAASFGPVWLAGTWSLAVEEQFYLTLPFMIRKLTPRLLGWCVLAAFLGATILRAAVQKFRLVDPMGGYVLLPSRIDALAAGVLITMLLRYRYHWIAGKERRIRLAVMAFVLIWIAYEYIPNPQAVRLAFLVHTGNAIAFAGILLALLLSPRALLSRFLSTPTMRGLGNMAYSTYLFHPILLCIVFRVIKGYDPVVKDAADLQIVGLALILTLLLSWLSWRFFEKPLIRRGHQQYQY